METIREMSFIGAWEEWEDAGMTREEMLAGKVGNAVEVEEKVSGDGGGGGEGKKGKKGFWGFVSGGGRVEKGYLGRWGRGSGAGEG